MASKASPCSRSEVQEAIRKQGEMIRKLKLEEQTDEVKNKVKFQMLFYFLTDSFFKKNLKFFGEMPVFFVSSKLHVVFHHIVNHLYLIKHGITFITLMVFH